MEQKMKVLVMYSGVIDMEGKDGRDPINGVSLEYYFFGENGENLAPKLSVDGVSGTRRGKSFLDPEIEKKVSYIPGIYDGSFVMNISKDGKAQLKLVDLDFISKVSITALEEKVK